MLAEMRDGLGLSAQAFATPLTVLDEYVGEGYSIPTPASTEALQLLAATEGVLG